METLLGLDLTSLIKAVGVLGIGLIIFFESGVFIGLFLPGDSLLFTAGFLASQGFLELEFLILFSIIGAILGDNFGYTFGRKVGPKIFAKEKSIFFSKEHLEKSRLFYEKHGAKTVVLARFMPIVRTFAPILAGVGKMRWRTFVFYNICGGIFWVLTLSLLGFTLGKTIPDADRYLLPIIFLIVLISVSPTLWQIWRRRSKNIPNSPAN